MSSINPLLPRISPHDPHAQAHHLAERIDTIVPRLADDLIAEIASKNEPEFLIGVIGFVETPNRRFRLTAALIKSLPSSSERETHLKKN